MGIDKKEKMVKVVAYLESGGWKMLFMKIINSVASDHNKYGGFAEIVF